MLKICTIHTLGGSSGSAKTNTRINSLNNYQITVYVRRRETKNHSEPQTTIQERRRRRRVSNYLYLFFKKLISLCNDSLSDMKVLTVWLVHKGGTYIYAL